MGAQNEATIGGNEMILEVCRVAGSTFYRKQRKPKRKSRAEWERGPAIRSMEELALCFRSYKFIYTCWDRHPVAVVKNWQYSQLERMVSQGRIWWPKRREQKLLPNYYIPGQEVITDLEAYFFKGRR
jgi:hypothetical protein